MQTKPDWRVGSKGNGRDELKKVGKANYFQGSFFIKRKKKSEMIPELEWECGVKKRFFFLWLEIIE